MGRWASRTATTLLIVAMLLFLLTALIMSPVALRALATVVPRSEWTVLSEIGQAYGPAAMLLTAFSLMAVAYTALLQLRSTRAMSQQTWRLLNFELIRLAMDEPALIQADGSRWDGPKEDFSTRLLILANAWVNHWWTSYTLGLMDDAEVRESANSFFRGEIGRRHWTQYGDTYRAGAGNRRSRAFCRLLDEELAKAASFDAHPVVIPNAASPQKRTLAFLSAGIAVAVGVSILRKRRF
jgi:hypothetical protein